MTDQNETDQNAEDLDEENGELLPERAAMSVIQPPGDAPAAVEPWADHDVPPPDPPQT
jgi:hypothetical protein